MPIARREAEIVWDGPLASGTGTLTTGSGALSELPVTWASRTERADGKTSPEELIAAAHSSCFAMALSLVLGENQTPPDRVTVNAACTLDEVDGAPRITTAELTVGAEVPGIEAAARQRRDHRAELTRAPRGEHAGVRGKRACGRPFVAVAPHPAGGRGRRHRARPPPVRSTDPLTAPRRLRGGSLVRCGRRASPRARRLQRTDPTARR